MLKLNFKNLDNFNFVIICLNSFIAVNDSIYFEVLFIAFFIRNIKIKFI